jgi:hypothetical protein
VAEQQMVFWYARAAMQVPQEAALLLWEVYVLVFDVMSAEWAAVGLPLLGWRPTWRTCPPRLPP